MLGDNVFTPPRGFDGILSPTNIEGGHQGGCATFVRTDVPYSKLPLQTPFQAIAISIFLKRRYTLCNVYLSPNIAVSQVELENLIRQLPPPFLLLGDLNARHSLWGDVNNNTRGNMLASIIENSELCIINSEEPTHFHVQTGTTSIIDLSIASPECALDFVWSVQNDLHGSDHYPIFISIPDSPLMPRIPRWLLDKADWDLFNDFIVLNCSASEFASADEAVQYFTNTLHQAAVRAIPQTSGQCTRRPVPWWNSDCAAARKACRAAYSRFHANRQSEFLKIQYKRARAKYKWTLKNARRSSWRQYVSSVNSSTPISQVWKRVSKIQGKYSPPRPPVLKIGNTLVADSKKVATAFAEQFYSVSKKDPTRLYSEYRNQQERQLLDFNSQCDEAYNKPITARELRAALGSCKATAPGHDGIHYDMLNHLGEDAFTFLLDLFNRLWREGVVPESWRMAIILPIPKPGKDHSVVSSFRPISLTSCLCKLLEKNINVRLVWFLENGSFLSESQCGFRKMRSTEDNLLRLESSVCSAFSAKQHHITVFFDLEKAYDTAWRYGILSTLHGYGLRGHLPIFIRNFLSERFFKVRVGCEHSPVFIQEEGVPQGSVLSVTLFAVAINGIVSVLPRDVKSSLFVDDFSLSYTASRMTVAERQLQLAINKVSTWALKRNFRFSPAKTVVMHFCRIRGVHPDPDLYLYGQRIQCREEVRFLGLIFDPRLTWVPHIRKVKAACVKAQSLLKVLSHTDWGADSRTLLMLHKALILSKLEYGSVVYSSATPARLKTLDSVHHGGLRMATGAFRTSPIPSLLVASGEMGLEHRRQSLILRTYFRIQRLPHTSTYDVVKNYPNGNVYTTHTSYPRPHGYRAQEILSTLDIRDDPVMPCVVPKIPPWVLPEVDYCQYGLAPKATTSDLVLRTQFLAHAAVHAGSVLIYTDGSKSDAGVGFGVIFPDFNRHGSLPSCASIFTAELSAILMSLNLILIHEAMNYTVFSDSQAALCALKHFNSPHPLVQKILATLQLILCRGKSVSFCWVPAHVGIQGNECADREARAAASLVAPNRPIPYRDYFPYIRKTFMNAWQNAWDALPITNKLREIQKEVGPRTFVSQTRRWETVVTRLRIGHSRLTHVHLMEGNPQPHCDDCLVPQTIRHLLVECPSLEDERHKYFSGFRANDGSYTLSSILGEEACVVGGATHSFLEDNGFLKMI
jgi:ribonuclease HI